MTTRLLVLAATTALTNALAGCAASSSAEDERATSASLDGKETLASVLPVAPDIPSTIAIEPTNGAVFDALTDDREVSFGGFSTAPGKVIEVQVLARPQAPVSESSWVKLVSTTSATAPTTYNDPVPIFRWSASAIPSPRGSGRWESGGLLRYRAIVNDGGRKTALPFFDASAGTCVAALPGKSWKEVLARCKSPYSPELDAPLGGHARAAALVSATPAPRITPPYLSRKGDTTEDETAAYYASIGAPISLTEFQARFGFSDSAGVEATYFNAGDLGIGREMHCTTFANAEGTGTACYVRNYGVDANNQPVFGGNAQAALDDAIGRRNSFATVAMVKLGSTFSPKEGNDVRFFVYGANETLVNRARLDNFGLNQSIPNNCLNCHGGKNDAGRVVGASLLPFDPEAFLFSKAGPFTYEAQEEQLRRLNVLMAGAGAPPPILQFVDGLYSGKAATPGTKAALDWIPKGWVETEESKTFYREVYKRSCRTCHVSQVGDYAFMRFDEFKKHNVEAARGVCKTSEMPIAEATTSLFLQSSARAYFVNALGLSSACVSVGGATP